MRFRSASGCVKRPSAGSERLRRPERRPRQRRRKKNRSSKTPNSTRATRFLLDRPRLLRRTFQTLTRKFLFPFAFSGVLSRSYCLTPSHILKHWTLLAGTKSLLCVTTRRNTIQTITTSTISTPGTTPTTRTTQGKSYLPGHKVCFIQTCVNSPSD